VTVELRLHDSQAGIQWPGRNPGCQRPQHAGSPWTSWMVNVLRSRSERKIRSNSTNVMAIPPPTRDDFAGNKRLARILRFGDTAGGASPTAYPPETTSWVDRQRSVETTRRALLPGIFGVTVSTGNGRKAGTANPKVLGSSPSSPTRKEPLSCGNADQGLFHFDLQRIRVTFPLEWPGWAKATGLLAEVSGDVPLPSSVGLSVAGCRGSVGDGA
jgi:hypothetical protein